MSGSYPGWSTPTGQKGLPLWDEATKDWLATSVSTLEAWEDSRLEIVSLDALPTNKRVVAWFPGPVEDTKWYLLRLRMLNWVLNTGHLRGYERREEPNGVALCSASI